MESYQRFFPLTRKIRLPSAEQVQFLVERGQFAFQSPVTTEKPA
jgi:hypothetical protein